MERNHSLIFASGIIAVLTLALSLRLLGLGHGLWLDENFSVILSEALDFTQNAGQAPLYFWLLRLWRAGGESDVWLQLLSVPFGLALVGVGIALGSLHNRIAGLLAGLFFATLPAFLRYSVEVRAYAVLLLFSALALYFLATLSREPGSRRAAIGASLALCLAQLTHPIAVFLLPTCLLFFLVDRKARRRWAAAVGIFTPPALAFLALYGLIYRYRGPTGTWMPYPEARVLWDTLLWNLGAVSPASKLFFGKPRAVFTVSEFVRLGPSLAGLGAGMALSAWVLVRSRAARPWLLASAAWVGILYLYSVLVSPLFWDRTLLPAMVPWLVGLAVAASESGGGRRFAALGLVLLACLQAGAWATRWSGQEVENWKSVCERIEREWQPGDQVLLNRGHLSRSPLRRYLRLPPDSMLAVQHYEGIADTVEKIETAWKRNERNRERKLFVVANFPLTANLARYLENKLGKGEKWEEGPVNLWIYRERKPWLTRLGERITDRFRRGWSPAFHRG